MKNCSTKISIFKMTMSITPSLCEMLADPVLGQVNSKTEQIDRTVVQQLNRTNNGDYHNAPRMCHNNLKYCYDFFVNRYNKNILNAFEYFQDKGNLEIITCGATHGFMPLRN